MIRTPHHHSNQQSHQQRRNSMTRNKHIAPQFHSNVQSECQPSDNNRNLDGSGWHGQRFSDEVHFVCPWHGYEYDLKTGECAADRRLRLKTYQVVRRGEDIYVVA